MKVLSPIQALIFALSVFATAPACGHGGDLDANGGHLDIATLTYHCHRDDCLLPLMDEPIADVARLSIMSFNVQFLGNSPVRDNESLASLLSDYDIIVIQELVSPPFEGSYPDGTPFKPDAESAAFFEALMQQGYEFLMSPEDTGTGNSIHRNGSSTEWWVAFYDPDSVQPNEDIPHGFIEKDRSNHDDYERVPFAFSFQATDGPFDFVLISTHLKPSPGLFNRDRRRQELDSIARWIDSNDDVEQDFIILGDMNLYQDELDTAIPDGYLSLNADCRPTNTNVKSPQCYDHVLYRPLHTTDSEMDSDSFRVINLIDSMRGFWLSKYSTPYPGSPYNHNEFRRYYSDHHPIVFSLTVPGFDDDGN